MCYSRHGSCCHRASQGGFMESIRKQQGFTLVEIAIVLVIIGLLLGGILKGQEMITQAKIKNVIADFSGISAAYHGYVDRYKKIPGDDPCAGGAVTVDNCVPTSGSVRGQLQAAPNPAVAKQAAANYAETGTNVYAICRAL